ncbi:uncharacterized protein MELLADRAFT_108590 [Melampsora larici-populina 98AG31]|uniref:Uncharacterized protein n=1 Tax=Melampsora larici-populina (strain 98AG31 / pathotype 3-4-7) TaxID=747676 RepID=F4RTL1_MELLP|nr:uncharacterized protein MELLADRAFT_108590 [Melampsora larici-populina 98AG31]EGG04276.1 hypothetical protein MELLADRAFT_108590 [Melampsora larici-populina 98AG31]
MANLPIGTTSGSSGSVLNPATAHASASPASIPLPPNNPYNPYFHPAYMYPTPHYWPTPFAYQSNPTTEQGFTRPQPSFQWPNPAYMSSQPPPNLPLYPYHPMTNGYPPPPPPQVPLTPYLTQTVEPWPSPLATSPKSSMSHVVFKTISPKTSTSNPRKAPLSPNGSQSSS